MRGAAAKWATIFSGLMASGWILAGCQNRVTFPGDTLGVANAIGTNTLAVQVGNCGPNGYVNEPCVSVTVCTPGTNTCQTIPDVLVDTGSYGLRIFSQALSIPLTQETDSSGHSIGECAYFGSANDWGTVQIADVQMGGELAKSLPVHVMNSNFASVPSPCTSPETGPSDGGYNGILGVGLFQQDCGDDCVTDANNESYYSCVGTTCTNITVTLAQQVTNPVAFLPLDNNGVSLTLPSVSSSGASLINGVLTLGIGTQADNTPSGVTTYAADSTYGEFNTIFNGTSYNDESFIDSGSNGLFFPSPSSSTLPDCPDNGSASGFFCPTTPQSYTATQAGYSGSPQNMVSFQISNADDSVNSSNNVFINLGGSMTGGFDWGLPFFLGRTVYVGIGGSSSSLGSGPYWAY